MGSRHDQAIPVPRQGRTGVPAAFVPFEAKFRVPEDRPGLVPRQRLTQRLRSSTECVVVVAAPPGYGKTTLLAEWARHESRPVAWLTVDDADNDPAVLLSYMLAALDRAHPMNAGIASAVLGGDVAILTVALPRLAAMLLGGHRPFVVVLDDAHLVTNRLSLEVMAAVAENMPSGSQLVLSGREDPRLPRRWGDGVPLLRLGVQDLVLSVDEATAVLASAGLSIPAENVTALVLLAEGWAAGLYLAAQAIRGAGGWEAAVAGLTGSEGALADYLRDDLLAGMSSDDVQFLTRTSILNRLSPALCDRVLERSGSGSVLERLARSNHFLVSLGSDGEWYRYHHLFASLLLGELRLREPNRENALHVRASVWFEEHGDHEEAVRHARAGGDRARAARLIWAQTPWLLAGGRRATLERWIGQFEPPDVLSEPWLSMSAAWCAVQSGREVESWLTAAIRGADGATGDEALQLTGAIALLRANLAHDGVATMLADAELAARLSAPDDPWRSMALFYQGVALFVSGRRDEAEAVLEGGVEFAAARGVETPRAQCLAQLALLAAERDDWAQATFRAGEARELVLALGLRDVPTLAPVFYSSALVLAHAGRVEPARRESRHAHRLISLVSHFAPWAAVQGRVVLARTDLSLGNPSSARMLLMEARGFIPLAPDARVLKQWLDDTSEEVQQLPGTSAEVLTLTTAELRVLQYLPTHLSFEEVGERLSLARSTVKSQATAIYRKLGVQSRAEAVDAAHAAGMLEENGERQLPSSPRDEARTNGET